MTARANAAADRLNDGFAVWHPSRCRCAECIAIGRETRYAHRVRLQLELECRCVRCGADRPTPDPDRARLTAIPGVPGGDLASDGVVVEGDGRCRCGSRAVRVRMVLDG